MTHWRLAGFQMTITSPKSGHAELPIGRMSAARAALGALSGKKGRREMNDIEKGGVGGGGGGEAGGIPNGPSNDLETTCEGWRV